jgi:hypothetical protein
MFHWVFYLTIQNFSLILFWDFCIFFEFLFHVLHCFPNFVQVLCIFFEFILFFKYMIFFTSLNAFTLLHMPSLILLIVLTIMFLSSVIVYDSLKVHNSYTGGITVAFAYIHISYVGLKLFSFYVCLRRQSPHEHCVWVPELPKLRTP